MTTYYARAAGGNWGTATTWSLTSGGGATGSVPTAADDCILDAASGTVTINGTSGSPSLCRSLTCTGFTGTLTQGSSAYLRIGDGTTGHLVLVAGMTYTPNATSVIQFVSTTTGNQITTAGKSMGQLVFDGVGGAWTLQDSLTQSTNSSCNVTLTNGSLDLNGQTVTIMNFSSSNSNTRSLTFGASTMTVGASTINSSFDIATSTNMTLSAASSTITFPQTTASPTFSGGGLTYGTINATSITSGEMTLGGFTCATLSLNNGASITSRYSFNGNATVTGTGTFNGNSSTNRPIYRSSVRGTQRTLTVATVASQNSDWQDIVGAGAGSWDLSAITGLSGDCGGNTGLTLTTPVTNYWVPSAGTSTGNFNAVTRWANASGGTAGTGRIPLPQDTCVIDANSIDAGSRTLTQGLARIGAINFTGATNTPTFTTSTVAAFFGSITLISAMTLSVSGQTWTYEGRGASTLTTATKSWPKDVWVDCAGGSLTLGDAFTQTSGNQLVMKSGTFDLSTYAATITSNVNLSAATGTAVLIVGAGGISGTTFNISTNATATFNGTGTFSSTFSSSGGALNINADVTITSTGSITGGTITGDDATLSFSGGSITFPASGGGGSTSYTWVG